jgi:TatA/E family protein of Tat protein translocase
MPELILIFVVALLVFGPRKLPEIGKSLGRGLAEFKKASDDLKKTIEQEIEEAKTEVSSVQSHVKAATDSIARSSTPEPPPAASAATGTPEPETPPARTA